MARLQFDIDGDDALKMTTTAHPPDGYIEIKDVSHKPRPGIDLYLSQHTSPGQWLPISEVDALLIVCAHEMRKILKIGGYYRFCCPAADYPEIQKEIQ